MKLVLDNGQEIILGEETNDIIMKEIEKTIKPKRNFNHEENIDSYFIGYDGKVEMTTSDNGDVSYLNSFTNEDYAKKIARRQYIDKLILNFIDENRVIGFDKNNPEVEKYSLYYNNTFRCLDIDTYRINQDSGWVFPTKEIALQCVDKYENELIEFFTMEV